MRKFIKQIACAMTLALTVGALSVAAPAQAASGVTLARKDKVLYVGGAKGYSVLEDGTKKASVVKATYALKKQVKGLKKGQIVRFSSANEAVATVLPKKGTITSVAPGKVVIKVEVKEKDKKTKKYKVVDTLSFTVSVRKNNATAPVITNAPKGSVGIGKEVYKMEATWGDKAATDKKGWKVVEGSDIASITADGKITTTKAGTFKVQAYTYQSADYTGATAASEIIEMKAAVDVAEVKATAINKVQLTFNADAKGLSLTKDDFAMYGKETNYNREYPVKSVEVDGNIVTLTVYNNFKADVEYVVKYNKTKTELGFTLTGLTKTDVKQISVTPEYKLDPTDKKAYQDIEFKLLNEDGVDLAASYKGNVKFARKSGDISVVGTQVRFTDIGKSGVITATYQTTYVDGDGKTQTYKLTEDFAVNSIEKAATPFVLSNWYIQNVDEPLDGSLSESNSTIPINVKNAKLVVKVRDLDDEDDTELTLGDEKTTALELKSKNTDILTVSVDGKTLTPLKEGVATIFVQNKKYDGEFVASFEIEVTAKSSKPPVAVPAPTYKVTNVSASSDRLSLAAGSEQKLTITADVKYDFNSQNDRLAPAELDVVFTPKTAGAEVLTGKTDAEGKVSIVVDKTKFTNASTETTFEYDVAVKKGTETLATKDKAIAIKVKAAEDKIAKYTLVSDKNMYAVGEKAIFTLVGLDKDGYIVKEAETLVKDFAKASDAANEVSKGNTTQVAKDEKFFYALDKDNKAVDSVTEDGKLEILMAAEGTFVYKVSGVQYVSADGSSEIDHVSGSQVDKDTSVTVVKSLPVKSEFYYERIYTSITADTLEKALELFEVKTTSDTKTPILVTDLTAYTENTDYEVAADGTYVTIKNLKYKVDDKEYQFTGIAQKIPVKK